MERMRPWFFLLGLLIFASVGGIRFTVASEARGKAGEPTPTAVERRGDWVVTGHEVVRNQHIRLNGNIILERGGCLELSDCTLEIIGRSSREHLIEWRGGRLVTRNCTIGGCVVDGRPIHTVFHIYDGSWEATDTVVQYAYGISFHAKTRGVLRAERLRAGPRPDAVIASGKADITLIDSEFPLALGIYTNAGGAATLDLPVGQPITTVFDGTNIPGAEYRVELRRHVVPSHWFVFLRRISMAAPPCVVTLRKCPKVLVSLLGWNLRGEVTLNHDLDEPIRIGNVTLQRTSQPIWIGPWNIYGGGPEHDLTIHGPGVRIAELMQQGGTVRLRGTPGTYDLRLGCTTLELSKDAHLDVQNAHLGQSLGKGSEHVLGEANVAGQARLTGRHVRLCNLVLHTKESGTVELEDVEQQGTVEKRVEGGPIRLSADRPRAQKPRLIVLADMGNEPDEEQQMIHLLMYANELDIEGLIAVTGKYLNEHAKQPYRRRLHPELFHRLIDGYAQVVDNLRLHAAGWPSPDELHRVVACGQPRYGMAAVGDGKSTEGSRLIIKAVTAEDPRPVNIVVNAGSNTLAQALWDYRATHTEAEVKAFVAKLRVFENGAQDNAGAWICHEFPEIHWIRSNHQTYGYMGEGNGVGPWAWRPYPRTNRGQHQWAEQHIMRGHGALGAMYPYRFGGRAFLEGGGTVPFLGLVNRGLYDIDHPSWGGWSGRFTATKQKNVWSRHADVRKDEKTYGEFAMFTEVADDWTDPEDGTRYHNIYAPVWRWRRDILNEFQARMDWCVKPYREANHRPVAAVDGDASDTIIQRSVSAGDVLTFDASRSTDPDNDPLTFRWYIYREAGTYPGAVPLEGTDRAQVKVFVPEDAAGKTIHLILEVRDRNSIVPLVDYRRIVLNVQEGPARRAD